MTKQQMQNDMFEQALDMLATVLAQRIRDSEIEEIWEEEGVAMLQDHSMMEDLANKIDEILAK